MKPRLRKSARRATAGKWVCECERMVGYGDTPREAYDNCMRWVWAELWARCAPTAQRFAPRGCY